LGWQQESYAFALAVVGVAMATLLFASAARADFKVKLPEVNPGEFELETVGSYGRSGNPLTDNEKSFVHQLEYGFSNFWKSGLEFETDRAAGPGNHLQFDALTWENWFVMGEPGQYWLDAALFAVYSRGMLNGSPDGVKFGPLLRKQIGPTINTVKSFFG